MPDTSFDGSSQPIPSSLYNAHRDDAAPSSSGSPPDHHRKRIPNVLGALIRSLTWFLYGTQLLTPAVALWIVSAWLIVGAMAMVEGVTWGWMLMQMIGFEHAAQFSLAAGIVWGIAVYIIDTNFCTMDTLPRPVDVPAAGQGAPCARLICSTYP